MEILVSSVNGRSDRNDVLLQELVTAGNWKQALINCDKRLKKSKDVRLLVNRAFILLNTPGKHINGETALDDVLKSKPPISDTDILNAIEGLASENPSLRASSEVSSMWERAAVARPDDESLYDWWFRNKFANGQYASAQKAAMMHSKRQPRRRDLFFRMILCHHLTVRSRVSGVDGVQKDLSEQMAYRLCSTAVSATREQSSSNSARCIKGPDDLELIILVYISQRKYQEALDVLDDERTGLSSTIGRRSWDLVRYRLELLDKLEKWHDLWSFCSELLEETSYNKDRGKWGHGIFGDDQTVWDGLIRACSRINTAENSAATNNLILSLPNSFNARVALMAFYASVPVEISDGLLSACCDFYGRYHTKLLVYRELRPFVYSLKDYDVNRFVDKTASCAREARIIAGGQRSADASTKLSWIEAEISALKEAYCFKVSCGPRSNTDTYTLFICTCLRLWAISRASGLQFATAERRPGDDAAILAATACIGAHFQSGSGYSGNGLLRAALILETLLSDSKHNYDALVLIIRLYLYLGAVTRALTFVERLELKNLQNLTTSWMFFTRISTIHPHMSSQSTLDPSALLSRIVKWIKRRDGDSDSTVLKCVENQAWASVINTLDFDDRYAASIPKFIMICEHSKLAMAGQASSGSEPRFMLDGRITKLQDAREDVSFINYEAHNQPSTERLLAIGPTPHRTWLASQMLLLTLKEVFRDMSTASELLLHAQAWAQALDDTVESSVSDLTDPEKDQSDLLNTIFKVCCDIQRPSAKGWTAADNDHVKGCITAMLVRVDALEKWMQWFDAPNDPWLHWWKLHFIHVQFENLSLVMDFMRWIDRRNLKPPVDGPDWIRKQVVSTAARVQAMRKSCENGAVKRQWTLRAGGTVTALIEYIRGGNEDAAGRELLVATGDVQIRRFAEEFLKSVDDTLDGLQQIKCS